MLWESPLSIDYHYKYSGAGGACYWAGSNPPGHVDCFSGQLLDRERAFRERPDRHGVFDAVYFIEENLGAFRQWRILLDEMVRLLRPASKTILVLRLNPVEMHRAEFVGFLESRSDCSFILVEQPASDLLVLECLREATAPRLDNIGFGVISDGRRPDILRRFVKSLGYVRGLEALDWQLALCGPPLLREQISLVLAEDNLRRVLFVDEPEMWREAGWITRKKNLLVEVLSTENLVILHDRYIVPEDFLERLVEFGADFDLVVPRQLRNGLRFPDWTATDGAWGTSKTYLLPYDQDSGSIYVNGGALIAKRDLLLKSGGWSNLLFWNQSEDVEFTRRLVHQGIVPRMAPLLSLETLDARAGYELAFERTRYDASAMPTDCSFPQGVTVDLRGVMSDVLERKGVIAWPTLWRASREGLVARQGRSELVLCHVQGNPARLRLALAMSGPCSAALKFWINGHAVEPEPVSGGIALPLEDLPRAAGGQLVLTCSVQDGELVIGSLELERREDRTALHYPVVMAKDSAAARCLLGNGWWEREPWGVWSEGRSSSLYLPPPGSGLIGARDLILKLGIKALPDPNLSHKPIGIACNNVPLSCLTVQCDGKVRSYRVRIPYAVSMSAASVTIDFLSLAASSPLHARNSDDRRLIGFGLTKIDLYASGLGWRRLFSKIRR